MTAPDADPFDAFGYAVDLAGDLLVVGAPLDDERGPSAGAVYLFRVRDGRAVLEAKIPGTVAGEQYGTTVAVTADARRFAVGARRGDGAAGADVGYVEVFDRRDGLWVSELRIQPARRPPATRWGSTCRCRAPGWRSERTRTTAAAPMPGRPTC